MKMFKVLERPDPKESGKYVPFEEWCEFNQLDTAKLAVSKTTNGFQLLTYGSDNKVVATIQNSLKGATPNETMQKMVSTVLTVRIPENATGNYCICEDKGFESEWTRSDTFAGGSKRAAE